MEYTTKWIRSIRKRRRDRTCNRKANQKELDDVAYKRISESMMASSATWDGTVCPECHKSVPARAFVVGGDIQYSASCIVTVGTSVAPQYCHRNTDRCASESAKEDKEKWMMSPLFSESQFDKHRKNVRDRNRAKAKQNYDWSKNNE